MEQALVSLDWLALSCLTQDIRPEDRRPHVPRGYTYVPQSATATWQYRGYLLDAGGNKVATYLYGPRGLVTDQRRMLVEVANRWLYDTDFQQVTSEVLSVYPCVVTGVNRIDICCDFMLDEQAEAVVRGLADGSMYMKAVRMGSLFWQVVDGKKWPHCQSWGSKVSSVKWKLYWKWLELHADGACSKPYIEALWQQMGLEPRRVWRLEVSLSDCNKFTIFGERLTYDYAYEHRTELFRSLYLDKFVVRVNEGHADRRNDPRVYLFTVESINKMVAIAKHDPVGKESDPERRVATKLWNEIQTPDVQANAQLFETVSGALATLCQSPSVFSYLQRISGLNADELCEVIKRGSTTAKYCGGKFGAAVAAPL